MKAQNLPFNHLGLVKSVMGRIPNEFVMKVAAHSVPAIMNAVPIAPLPNE